MAIITRRITKRGVRIQGCFYISEELAPLIGHLVTVEAPEGPLPQTLSVMCETQSLVIRVFPELPEYIRTAMSVFHSRRCRRNCAPYTSVPSHTHSPCPDMP